MSDDEFRKLYCWLVERVKPSAEVVARVLRSVLEALEENRRKRGSYRIEQLKESEKPGVKN